MSCETRPKRLTGRAICSLSCGTGMSSAARGIRRRGRHIIPGGAIGSIVDERNDYGEVRANAFGLINGRLFVCTYTMRGAVYRLICVRKASKKERATWL